MEKEFGESQHVTRLLQKWAGGDEEAREQLIPIVYDSLRRLAAKHMSAEYSGPRTMQATALVHEAYLRLVDQGQPHWESRKHFYGVLPG
jgi:RNA polymerase sigma-70 factor (ECF subfamily)